MYYNPMGENYFKHLAVHDPRLDNTFRQNHAANMMRAAEIVDYGMAFFTQEHVEAAIRERFTDTKELFDDSQFYYSPQLKTFYELCVDGNYYHGYETTVSGTFQLYVIEYGLRHFKIEKFLKACKEQKVPEFLMVAFLEEDLRNINQKLPGDDSLGSGKYWI